jgi:hypothetical protein
VKTGVLAALPPDRLNAAWLRHRPGKLYPAHTAELCAHKASAIVENPKAIAEYRSRLTNLSWLMKSLSEPIARRTNAEDKVTGRFWDTGEQCRIEPAQSQKN